MVWRGGMHKALPTRLEFDPGPVGMLADYQVLLPSQVEPAVRGRTGRRRVENGAVGTVRSTRPY